MLACQSLVAILKRRLLIIFFMVVATLMFVTGEKMIRHLFSRETYGEFEYDVLLVVLAVYFVGSCYSANMSISVGLVIPQLYARSYHHAALFCADSVQRLLQ